MVRLSWSVAATVVATLDVVLGLGTNCTTPLGGGTAPSGQAYWLQSLAARGRAPYNSNPSGYVVRRNVKGELTVILNFESIYSPFYRLWCEG